jgi:hypothetical protein
MFHNHHRHRNDNIVFSIPGKTGPMGPPGSNGNPGSTGPRGYTGATGVSPFQGLTGPQGNTGFQGFTGVQGNQGFTGFGLPGMNGSTGLQGFTGFQGFQGVTGAGYQGSTGPMGLQGFTGPIGYQGVTGAGYQGSTGPMGLQGFTGPIGYQGFTGAGYQGFTGLMGSQGSTGSIGYQGATGAGYQGSTGPLGLQGFTGPIGYQGSTGIGLQGITGPMGLQGFTGPIGFQGSTGIGLQGITGPLGLQGFTGPCCPGSTGPLGLQGFTGPMGYQGFTGPQGATGGYLQTQRTLFVDPNFNNVYPYFSTIGNALNYINTNTFNPALSSTTPIEIIIYAGTYNESNNLIGNVNLTGYNGSVIINGNITWNSNFTDSAETIIIQNLNFTSSGLIIYTYGKTGVATLSLSSCTFYNTSISVSMNFGDFFNFENCLTNSCRLNIVSSNYSSGDGPTFYIANSVIELVDNNYFGFNGPLNNDMTNGIIENVIINSNSNSEINILSNNTISFNNVTINLYSIQIFLQSSTYPQSTGTINFNSCNIACTNIIKFCSTSTVNFNNCSVTASSIQFGNTNANFTSFTTGSISLIGNGSDTGTSANVSFNGSNNTFSDNGALTTAPFISTDSMGLLFNSPNSTFLITSSGIASGTVFSISNAFNAPNSSFNITNLNSTTNPCLFNSQGTSPYNYIKVSGSTFTITGTTSQSLIQVSNSASTFIGRNCVFDCSQMTSATFATITAGTMNIANSIVDLTDNTSTSYNYINNSGKLIAPACTFINATGPLGATGPFIYNQANANLLNCNFSINNPNIINTGTGSITDISPYFKSFGATGPGYNSIKYGLSYSDTNYQASIMGVTATGPLAPFINSVTTSGLTCYIQETGTYNLIITKQYSNIL